MKRVIGLWVVLATAVAACGGGGSSVDPASASSCEELADVGIAMVQDAIDDLGSMSLEDFVAASDERPEALTRLDEQSTALEARAAELGCTETDAQELLCERVDRLDSDTEVGDLMVQSFISACS
jgi:hypothetical protein